MSKIQITIKAQYNGIYNLRKEGKFIMGLFGNNNDTNIQRGDRVQVRYAGIEGIVVSVNGTQVMISYQNEQDREIVETYNIEDVEKC